MGLPEGWIMKLSAKYGRKYYYNPEKMITQWQRPKEENEGSDSQDEKNEKEEEEEEEKRGAVSFAQSSSCHFGTGANGKESEVALERGKEETKKTTLVTPKLLCLAIKRSMRKTKDERMHQPVHNFYIFS